MPLGPHRVPTESFPSMAPGQAGEQRLSFASAPASGLNRASPREATFGSPTNRPGSCGPLRSGRRSPLGLCRAAVRGNAAEESPGSPGVEGEGNGPRKQSRSRVRAIARVVAQPAAPAWHRRWCFGLLRDSGCRDLALPDVSDRAASLPHRPPATREERCHATGCRVAVAAMTEDERTPRPWFDGGRTGPRGGTLGTLQPERSAVLTAEPLQVRVARTAFS